MFIEGAKASKDKRCILEKQVFAAIGVWEGVEVCGRGGGGVWEGGRCVGGVEVCGRCMRRGELCGRCGGVWEV